MTMLSRYDNVEDEVIYIWVGTTKQPNSLYKLVLALMSTQNTSYIEHENPNKVENPIVTSQQTSPKGKLVPKRSGVRVSELIPPPNVITCNDVANGKFSENDISKDPSLDDLSIEYINHAVEYTWLTWSN